MDETIREMELGGWSKGSLVGNNARNSDVAQQLEAACAEVERLRMENLEMSREIAAVRDTILHEHDGLEVNYVLGLVDTIPHWHKEQV